MEKIYKPILELHGWDLNPRDIDTDAYNRLKDQLSLKGQFSPLLVMEDGTVLGGNMRLRAMMELGIENVWVTLISFTKKETGLWHAVFEGVEQPEPFGTKEDAMMSWSLAHNADFGHYDWDKFANIQPNYGLNWEQFSVNFQIPDTIQDVIDSVTKPKGGGEDFKHTIIITVDSEEKQKELFSDLTKQGYNAKIKTTTGKSK